jgi:hypothetical protein
MHANLNTLITIGIVFTAILAALGGAAAIQADAGAVVAALATVGGALIGVGSTWAGAEWTRRARMADEKRQTLTSVYLEISGYLNQSVDPFRFFANAWKTGNITPHDYAQFMIKYALEWPAPAFFAANRAELSRLENPEAVIGFYNCLDVVQLQKSRPGMESIRTSPTKMQISHIIVHLGVMMKVGLDLLESSEFTDIRPIPRAQLIESLKSALATSPRRFMSAADFKQPPSGPG